MFIDIHEMGGTEYFFPPNADPYYHEVSNASVGYLDLYGGAMAEEFDRQGIPFFTGRTFDLFYAGYGDTFPTLGWNGAGMSALSCPTLLAEAAAPHTIVLAAAFEQGSASPFDVKVYNQYLASWMSISTAAVQRQRVLADWHAAYVGAAAQGSAGMLSVARLSLLTSSASDALSAALRWTGSRTASSTKATSLSTRCLISRFATTS